MISHQFAAIGYYLFDSWHLGPSCRCFTRRHVGVFRQRLVITKRLVSMRMLCARVTFRKLLLSEGLRLHVDACLAGFRRIVKRLMLIINPGLPLPRLKFVSSI